MRGKEAMGGDARRYLCLTIYSCSEFQTQRVTASSYLTFREKLAREAIA